MELPAAALGLVVILLAAGPSAGQDPELEFNYNKFEENWACPQNGSFLGNFPEEFYYHTDNRGYRLSSDPDSWTTFPTEHATLHRDDKRQVISQPWNDSARPVGFYLRPGAYGPENRIFLQMALNDKRPTVPPYPNVSQEDVRVWDPDDLTTAVKDYETNSAFWQLMLKGVFNCHVNRYLNAFEFRSSREGKTLRDRHRDRLERIAEVAAIEAAGRCDNPPDYCKDLLETTQKVHRWYSNDIFVESITCGAQKDHPMCCYAWWKDSLNKIEEAMGDAYEWTGQCREFLSLKDEVASVGPPWDRPDECAEEIAEPDSQNKVSFGQNARCNKYFYPSLRSCLLRDEVETEDGNATVTNTTDLYYPCVASCYTSLVLQLEIIPLEGKPAEFHISAVTKKYNRLRQPPANATLPRFFGHLVGNDEHRTDYIGAAVEGAAGPVLSTDKYTGIWLAWQRRGQDGSGPFLNVGEEGDSNPKMKIDLATAGWKINDQDEPYGFGYGWNGREMQRPIINNTFAPYFITLNTVKNAQPVSYKTEGNCPDEQLYKLSKGEKFTTTAIIIASCTLLGLSLIVVGLVFYFGKHKAETVD